VRLFFSRINVLTTVYPVEVIEMECGRIAWQYIFICVLCCFLWVNDVSAQVSQKDVPHDKGITKTASEGPIWPPSSDIPKDFDWIQLTSGEWLKGDLKVLYDDKLEFDSDELDLLELDWEDIKEIRGHRQHSVRFEGPVSVVGVLKVVGDKVFVITEEKVFEFDRSDLISIAYGEEKEIGYWAAKISLGLDIRKGNTDLINYSTSAYAKRQTSASRFYIDYLGIYDKTEGIETADSQRVSSHYDIFLKKKFFWVPVFAEYFKDRFSNIANRTTLGTGGGYTIIDTAKIKWDISPGLAYQYTKNVSVEAGEDIDASTPALVIGTIIETELTEKIDFDASYRFNIVNQDSGTYTHHLLAALEIELTERLDLDFSFVWDRIQDPKTAADGSVPEKDDFHFFFGLGFEL
jgi:putative salt-induced outer membrane protein YdiY